MTAPKRLPEKFEGASKLARLVKKLADAESALQAHAAGQVDAILDAGGHPFLLEQAQRRLIESEEVQRQAAALQKAILDALPANIALLNPEGVILAVNESWRRFGAANAVQGDDFFVGRNYLAICEGADGECSGEAVAAAEGIRRVLRGEEAEFSLEYPCHSPDEQRWYRLVATPLRPGSLTGAVVMHLNVTERKLAELALQESEGRQRRLAHQLESERSRLIEAQAVAKVGSWETNLASFEVSWSAETHHIFETDPASFAPTHQAFVAMVHPEDRAGVDAAFQSSLYEEGPRSVMHRIIVPDGRVKYVEERWRVIHGAEGHPERAIGTCRDITEQTLAERERRALADRLFTTLESITDGFIMLDNDVRFSYVNRRAEVMLHRSRAELVGRLMVDAFPDVVGTEFEAQYRKACTEQGPVEFEALYAPLECWFEVRAFPSADGLAVYLRDVTEERKAREDLARTHRALQMLSRCNETLVRSETEQELLEEICRLATEVGGYRMAWVGYAFDDREKSIVPQASAGADADYIARLHLSWSEDVMEGRGPAGRTVRSGQPVLVEDLAGFPYFAPWLEDAAKRGYRGLINLPLNDGRRTFGILSLYDGEVRQLHPDELKLLRDLADNLAFGITNLRSRVERRKTHDAVLAMARGLSAETGAEFFEKLTFSLVEALGADAGCIATVETAGAGRAWALAAVADGKRVDGFAFDLAGTACDHLDSHEVRLVPREAATRFSPLAGFSAQRLESYVGMTLFDGADRPAGVMFAQFRHPLSEEDFVVSTLRIFAARAAAELEREKAAARTREQAALLDKAQDAILVRDLEHRITYWNKSAERLYGWIAGEVLGQSERALLYFDPGPFDAAMEQTRAHGEWISEITQVRKDGQALTIEGRWTLVKDDAGRPRAVLAINTDITERKKLESQFLRAQRMESIGTLAGGIAHDLNNLLAPITMGVDLLKRFEPREESQRVIGNIERSARRGADLVKQVLSFARGVEGSRVAVNLKHVAHEIEVIGHNTFPKNIRIETHAPRDLWLVTGDPTQLNQVVLNLCVNARDAMPDGGRLSIVLQNVEVDTQYAVMNRGVAAGRYVVIEVADTGCGMSAEVQERVFEPFFTTKEVGKGTGLGLSTVIGIVRSHGGFVNVYSEPGRGSTFKVYLPAQSDGQGTAGAADERPSLPRGNGEAVLIVDDEASILEVTKDTLEAFGYRVFTAEDGAQAIGMYATHRDQISIVVTDMMMPVMDGAALISALRRISPQVKIIAASGLKDNGSVARATGTGVRHFLAKPYSADALLTMLHKVLHDVGSRAPYPDSSP